MNRRLIGLACAVAAVAVSAFGLIGGAAAQDDEWSSDAVVSTPSVDVVASDFKFDPQPLTVSSGAVTFNVRNQGVIDHNFAIEAPDKSLVATVAIINPGKSADVIANLNAGTYNIICTLPAHREAGMQATLIVTP